MASAPLIGADNGLCPVQEPIFTASPLGQGGQVDVKAANVVSGDNRLVFSGDVSFRRDHHHLEAQRVEYNSVSGDLLASGDVKYSTPKYELRSESFSADTNGKTFQSGAATYRIYLPDVERAANLPVYGGGKAAQIIHREDGVTLLEDVDYTTCLAGASGWKLSAGSLKLDPNEAEATAKNAWVALKGVPYLYVPWFRFPIGDVRKSGFLVPRFGTSDLRGNEYEFPVYLNIAPQADATITPRWMTKRGVQWRSEWRYLSRTGRWRLDDEYLDNDEQTDTQRRFTRLRHSGNPFQNWFSSIDASRVTDSDYFDDLGDSLDPTNIGTITHLERRADLTHIADNAVLYGQFQARLQVYQTVDESIAANSRPYERIPQLTYDATAIARPAGFAFDLESELTRFDRRDSITGDRFNLQPRVSFPLDTYSGFFRPSLSAWYRALEVPPTSKVSCFQ